MPDIWWKLSYDNYLCWSESCVLQTVM